MRRDIEAAFLCEARIRLEVQDLGNNRAIVLDLLGLAERLHTEVERVVRASNEGAREALRQLAELEALIRYVGIEPRAKRVGVVRVESR